MDFSIAASVVVRAWNRQCLSHCESPDRTSSKQRGGEASKWTPFIGCTCGCTVGIDSVGGGKSTCYGVDGGVARLSCFKGGGSRLHAGPGANHVEKFEFA